MLRNSYINMTKHYKHKINNESDEANLKLVKTITCKTVKFKINFMFRQWFSSDLIYIILKANEISKSIMKLCRLRINYKDRLPSFMRSSLVYRFSYARCACEYVGSTTRSLHTRVCEHIGKSRHTGLPLSIPQHSNIRLTVIGVG